MDLSRYYKIKNNTASIDLNLDYYGDFYNEWDFSRATKRDLDDELLEYLEMCVNEIPAKYEIKVNCCLPKRVKNIVKELNSTKSYVNFFNYQIHRYDIKKTEWFKSLGKYALLGFISISIAFFIGKFSENIVFTYLEEGFTIGGWVLFWEVFSSIFIRMEELNQKIANLKRLKDAELVYLYGPMKK